MVSELECGFSKLIIVCYYLSNVMPYPAECNVARRFAGHIYYLLCQSVPLSDTRGGLHVLTVLLAPLRCISLLTI